MKELFEFLIELSQNNNKPWFDSNRERYEQLKKELLLWLEELLAKMAQINPSIRYLQPKDCIFRINRDIRFSKNKSPYKTNFACYIAPGGKKSEMAAFYIHLEPYDSFIAAGIYQPAPITLAKIRNYILTHGSELINIINEAQFLSNFKELSEEKLKLVPKGYDSANPYAELLKYKSFIVTQKLEKDIIFKPNFAEKVLALYEISMPFNDFLNRAVVV